MAGSYGCWVGTNNCSQPVDVRCICGHNRKVSGCRGIDTHTVYHLMCVHVCTHVDMYLCRFVVVHTHVHIHILPYQFVRSTLDTSSTCNMYICICTFELSSHALVCMA